MAKLNKKLDYWFWFIVGIFPVFLFLTCYRSGASSINDYYTFEQFCEYFGFRFDFIANIITDVCQRVFSGDLPGTNFASYFIGIQIIHCFVDVLVFIPRFAHDLIDRSEHLWKKD